MCTNKFLIGVLIGIHVSSIVKWGYQDNFKPVYLFSYEKISPAQKALKHKQATFTLLEVCAREKLLPLLFSVCLILFCWLMFACECFFLRVKFFREKNINRLKIVLITSFHYSTLNNLKHRLLLQAKQNLLLIVTV